MQGIAGLELKDKSLLRRGIEAIAIYITPHIG